MKTAFIYGERDIRIQEVDMPSIGKKQALIKIKACGICPSDIRLFSGERPVHAPINPGHEFAGEVVEIEENSFGIHVGQRVVTDLRMVCNTCWYCRRGYYSHCTNVNSKAIYGGYCEYGYADISSLRKIPDGLSYEEASFSEPLACCLHSIDQCNIGEDSDVVVIGAGPIGLLHVQLAKGKGAQVFACDTIGARLQKALEVGADHVFHVGDEDIVSAVRNATSGRGASTAVVTGATVEAANLAMALIGPCGVVNFFTGFPPSSHISLDLNEIHYKQLRLLGTHNFTPDAFNRSLKLLGDRSINVSTLITHRFSLNDISLGFSSATSKTGLKTMIIIDPDQ